MPSIDHAWLLAQSDINGITFLFKGRPFACPLSLPLGCGCQGGESGIRRHPGHGKAVLTLSLLAGTDLTLSHNGHRASAGLVVIVNARRDRLVLRPGSAHARATQRANPEVSARSRHVCCGLRTSPPPTGQGRSAPRRQAGETGAEGSRAPRRPCLWERPPGTASRISSLRQAGLMTQHLIHPMPLFGCTMAWSRAMARRWRNRRATG